MEKQFILEFIRVYRKLRALWDVRNKDYVNRTKKQNQYEVLIEKYRERYPKANKQDVIRKINTLRTQFRKEVKRLQDGAREDWDDEDVRPKLWYFEEMSFLLNLSSDVHLSVRRDMIGLRKDGKSGIATATDDNAETERHFMKDEEELAEDPNVGLAKVACKHHQQQAGHSNAIAASWAAELRTMDPRQRLFAKKAINDVLFEGQMGTLHRHSVEINAGQSPFA